MRRFLVIFMLFLLPLRGLVGDAMAYSMLPAGMPVHNQVTQNAIDSVAINDLTTGTSSTIAHQNSAPGSAKQPCHMDMAAADDTDAAQSQCTTCQACHLSTATPLQWPCGILQNLAALPTQRVAHWTSAEARLLAKTPIL
ncbi:MAG: hypothetical protein WB821_16980 [Burkholderiaceae bacterium]